MSTYRKMPDRALVETILTLGDKRYFEAEAFTADDAAAFNAAYAEAKRRGLARGNDRDGWQLNPEAEGMLPQ